MSQILAKRIGDKWICNQDHYWTPVFTADNQIASHLFNIHNFRVLRISREAGIIEDAKEEIRLVPRMYDGNSISG